jgi:homoserine O-acetyltransferase
MEKLYVQPKSTPLTLPKEGLVLENGGALKEVTVAYEQYGTLNAQGTNAILVCTPLTMDAHAAGWYSDRDKAPGWWDTMIGSGKALDTDKFCVIATNVLGGCQGTTGPSSLNPDTKRPYGSAFPRITIGDMVHVQHLLLRQLGVSKLEAVVGGSMGGMQTLQWSVAYPNMVKKCVCIAAAPNLSPQALGFEIVGRKILENDAHYKGGDYYSSGNEEEQTPSGENQKPTKGLAFARMIGQLTYLAPDSMDSKFGRDYSTVEWEHGPFDTGYSVESYLYHNAQKFTERFDANSYMHITYAMDTFDLTETHGSLEKAFEHTQADFLLVALSSDWLFPPQQSRELAQVLLELGKITSLVELDSPYGHDAFLLEVDHLGKVLSGFLKKAHLDAPFTGDSKSHERDKRTVIELRNASTEVPHQELNLLDLSGAQQLIHPLIEPNSHVLDIGCGDGSLIDSLYQAQKTTGFGMDIDLHNVVSCLVKNVPVVHGDVDNNLSLFRDHSFDYAILSQTMQMLKHPDQVLQEMLRVAKKGIVVFPNFANIYHRLSILFKGVMPVNKDLPYNWWDSPNIHLFTYKDFTALCEQKDIAIEQTIVVGKRALSKLGLMVGSKNLGGEVVIAKVSQKKYSHT